MAVEQLVAFNRLFCYFPKDLCAKNDNYLAVFFLIIDAVLISPRLHRHKCASSRTINIAILSINASVE